MAVGRLGTARLAANTDTVVYTVPSGMQASISVNAVNMGASDAILKIAISLSDTVSAGDYIEMSTLEANGDIVERSAIILSAGERVIVNSTMGNIDIRVHGVEEAV